MASFLYRCIEPFCDDNGRLSSMRLMAFVVVAGGLLFFYEVLSVWKALCIAKQEFIPLNLGDYVGVLSSVAALFAKSIQKHIEVRGDTAQQFLFDADTQDESSAEPSPSETSPALPPSGPRRRPKS